VVVPYIYCFLRRLKSRFPASRFTASQLGPETRSVHTFTFFLRRLKSRFPASRFPASQGQFLVRSVHTFFLTRVSRRGQPIHFGPPWERAKRVQIRYESRALQAYMLAPIVLGRFQRLKPGCVSSRAYCHLLTCERSIRIDLNPILTRLQASSGNLNRAAFSPPTFEFLGGNVWADRVSRPHLRRGQSIHLLFFQTPEIAISCVSISRVSMDLETRPAHTYTFF
jgi:hypothetical protein